MWSFGGGGS
jgi:hypothetical protein